DAARVRQSLVRLVPSGAAARRRDTRRACRRTPYQGRRRKRAAPRALLRRQALADAGFPARRQGSRAAGAAPRDGRDRARARRDRSALREFNLVSEWRLGAPIERVWEALVRPQDWRRWWRYLQEA